MLPSEEGRLSSVDLLMAALSQDHGFLVSVPIGLDGLC